MTTHQAITEVQGGKKRRVDIKHHRITKAVQGIGISSVMDHPLAVMVGVLIRSRVNTIRIVAITVLRHQN